MTRYMLGVAALGLVGMAVNVAVMAVVAAAAPFAVALAAGMAAQFAAYRLFDVTLLKADANG